jgi:hypothetical protein
MPDREEIVTLANKYGFMTGPYGSSSTKKNGKNGTDINSEPMSRWLRILEDLRFVASMVDLVIQAEQDKTQILEKMCLWKDTGRSSFSCQYTFDPWSLRSILQGKDVSLVSERKPLRFISRGKSMDSSELSKNAIKPKDTIGLFRHLLRGKIQTGLNTSKIIPNSKQKEEGNLKPIEFKLVGNKSSDILAINVGSLHLALWISVTEWFIGRKIFGFCKNPSCNQLFYDAGSRGSRRLYCEKCDNQENLEDTRGQSKGKGLMYVTRLKKRLLETVNFPEEGIPVPKIPQILKTRKALPGLLRFLYDLEHAGKIEIRNNVVYKK